MATMPVLRRFCRECYNPPEALYERLKRLGLDLVTVTDHDSIDAGRVFGGTRTFSLARRLPVERPVGTKSTLGFTTLRKASM